MADKQIYEHVHILVNRKKEKVVIDFLDMQDNKSSSIKILIQDFVNRFGNVDVKKVLILPKDQ